ncbi:hypothetical protein K438DRAFT_1860587 [Mycena galopus ATCC 62051]|nr:hypothetical protein K438DRAFT_1860587 [Mycena galopus ATCC 62051]
MPFCVVFCILLSRTAAITLTDHIFHQTTTLFLVHCLYAVSHTAYLPPNSSHSGFPPSIVYTFLTTLILSQHLLRHRRTCSKTRHRPPGSCPTRVDLRKKPVSGTWVQPPMMRVQTVLVQAEAEVAFMFT